MSPYVPKRVKGKGKGGGRGHGQLRATVNPHDPRDREQTIKCDYCLTEKLRKDFHFAVLKKYDKRTSEGKAVKAICKPCCLPGAVPKREGSEAGSGAGPSSLPASNPHESSGSTQSIAGGSKMAAQPAPPPPNRPSHGLCIQCHVNYPLNDTFFLKVDQRQRHADRRVCVNCRTAQGITDEILRDDELDESMMFDEHAVDVILPDGEQDEDELPRVVDLNDKAAQMAARAARQAFSSLVSRTLSASRLARRRRRLFSGMQMLRRRQQQELDELLGAFSGLAVNPEALNYLRPLVTRHEDAEDGIPIDWALDDLTVGLQLLVYESAPQTEMDNKDAEQMDDADAYLNEIECERREERRGMARIAKQLRESLDTNVEVDISRIHDSVGAELAALFAQKSKLDDDLDLDARPMQPLRSAKVNIMPFSASLGAFGRGIIHLPVNRQ
ncbi:hypothetical protein BCV70DRAFT_113722 [Testicularia cyperi]|uniref:Stc1 domain-containing protein n=1 Tax=Testicularia cyperi TaxID=1882483 RepID=A0A317XR73_9BASI|nr:hypothetical protein BCV70DRAFT_113722 [Testicularia cyperi]